MKCKYCKKKIKNKINLYVFTPNIFGDIIFCHKQCLNKEHGFIGYFYSRYRGNFPGQVNGIYGIVNITLGSIFLIAWTLIFLSMIIRENQFTSFMQVAIFFLAGFFLVAYVSSQVIARIKYSKQKTK